MLEYCYIERGLFVVLDNKSLIRRFYLQYPALTILLVVSILTARLVKINSGITQQNFY